MCHQTLSPFHLNRPVLRQNWYYGETNNLAKVYRTNMFEETNVPFAVWHKIHDACPCHRRRGIARCRPPRLIVLQITARSNRCEVREIVATSAQSRDWQTEW